MTRRKMRRKPPGPEQDARVRPEHGTPVLSRGFPALPRGAAVISTDLRHCGRPVVWFDGVLCCDGQPIGRRPAP